MNRIVNKLGRKALPIAFFVLAISVMVFAQPGQTKTEAAKAYQEAVVLADEESIAAFQEALAKFQTAGNLYREIGDVNGEARSLLQIGFMFQRLGNFGDALESYKKAYALFEKTTNQADRAKTINLMGTVYSLLGYKKTALDLYNVALRIYYEIDDFDAAIPVMNNVGRMYQDAGDFENALVYFNIALPNVRESGDKGSEGMILINIGSVYSDKGEYDKAIQYFEQSLPLHRAAENTQGEVRTLYQLGVVSFRAGKMQDAVRYLNQSLALNGSRYKNEEALCLQYLMHSWKDLNQREIAIFYGKQGVNKYQELRQNIRILDTELQRTFLQTIENTYRQLADLLIEQGQLAQAEQVLRMLKEEEYFDFVRRDNKEIQTLDQRISLTERERQLVERYTALTNRITEIGREYANIEKKKRRSGLSAEDQKRFDELAVQIADANAAFTLFLEKELVAEFGKEARDDIEFDRTLQANLKKWGDGTVTLYTVVTKDRYRVILTTPTVQVDGKTEISAADLNKKIFAYREALQDIDVDPRPLGRELYDILIKPVEKDLIAANAKTLVWSLDGTLRYIPIATLSPDGKTYLVEKYFNVITTPRTRDDLTDSDAEWQALGVGVSEARSVPNPDDPAKQIKFNSIPGTRTELMTIIRDEANRDENGILSGLRLLNENFTAKRLIESLAVKTVDGKRKYTAVHIASHFRLGSNWSNSFLLLGDGQILTLEELKNSPALSFENVELITLSACNTAVSDDSNGREVDSLAAVIQSKSGQAVLAALWAVVDESTPLLMSEFYRLRKDNPHMTKAEAMQRVQKAFVTGELKPSAEYIEKLDLYYKGVDSTGKSSFKFDRAAPFAHPYFWSPFVLIGNWR